jgi:hypothetical protein
LRNYTLTCCLSLCHVVWVWESVKNWFETQMKVPVGFMYVTEVVQIVTPKFDRSGVTFQEGYFLLLRGLWKLEGPIEQTSFNYESDGRSPTYETLKSILLLIIYNKSSRRISLPLFLIIHLSKAYWFLFSCVLDLYFHCFFFVYIFSFSFSLFGIPIF